MFLWICIFALVGLAAYNVVTYLQATGTVWQRLAAAWQGSTTLFALIWGGIASVIANGMDALSYITGDPRFAQVGEAVKTAVPATWQPILPAVMLLLPLVAAYAARQRSLPKTGG